MIKEITAKTLLASVKQPEPWFGLRYNMNLYRGCQFQCIYCDSRSECYRIADFHDVLVKANGVELLRRELPRKRVKGTIGTGSMSDPYIPLEATRRLTGRALEVIAEHQFPVHIITKGDLVVRDADTLQQIHQVFAAVSFTITTADDALGKMVEPGAPLVSQRFRAMETLAARGLLTGVTLMPVLPFIEDSEANVRAIVTRAHECGARYVIAAFGMTLRDRQRAYYYAQLDRLLPGMRVRYEKHFGGQYQAPAMNAGRLEQVFREACARCNLATRMPMYEPRASTQPALL